MNCFTWIWLARHPSRSRPVLWKPQIVIAITLRSTVPAAIENLR